MIEAQRNPWRIAVCGSASVGKTSLVEALTRALGLSCLDEEMRRYLECTRVRLGDLSPHEVAPVLLQLWQERTGKERKTPAFVADNCVLDFVAYAIHYRCITEEMASVLLPETIELSAGYHAIFVLPWGVLPYVEDGVRTGNRHEQLGYQFTIEGLLRRYVLPHKIHYLPESLTSLSSRCEWVCSVLDRVTRSATSPQLVPAIAPEKGDLAGIEPDGLCVAPKRKTDRENSPGVPNLE